MSTPEFSPPPPTPSSPASPSILPAHLLAARSAKVRDHHLDRKAIVYIRQSSPQQVAEHKESTARQYALADVAVALGWPRDRVEIIDADQGRSGQTVEGRRGFQSILAQLSLDQVGIVLGLEASRLARSDPDWAPLVRSCGLFRALLGDYDGLYDPTDFNDRLLLGLKGIMSEAELHFLRARMHEGRLNKARRGELFNHAAVGYVREPGRGLALDPDEQAQQVVRMVFDQFDRQGTLHGLLRYLVHHGIRLPIRPHHGPNRGKLEWHRPNRETLQNMLHHPVYAGYYRHGHRALDPRRKVPGRPGTGRTINKAEDCSVLLEGRCPAYITPERFWANQERLAANRARTEAAGAVRQGPSLLGGILRCGRCGRRMTVSYSGPASRLRYSCGRAMVEYAEPLCQSLAGGVLDDLVAAQVLAGLEPAALELSMAAADDIEQERARLHRNWQQQVERARYEAERARTAIRRGRTGEPPGGAGTGAALGGRVEGAAPPRGGIRPVRPQPASGPVGWRARANPHPRARPAGAVAGGDDDLSGPSADRPPVGQGGGRHGPWGERTGRRDHPLGRGLQERPRAGAPGAALPADGRLRAAPEPNRRTPRGGTDSGRGGRAVEPRGLSSPEAIGDVHRRYPGRFARQSRSDGPATAGCEGTGRPG